MSVHGCVCAHYCNEGAVAAIGSFGVLGWAQKKEEQKENIKDLYR